MLLLADIGQNMLGLPDLPENNPRATFSFERHFTSPKRGETGGMWKVQSGCQEESKGFAQFGSTCQATEARIHGLFAVWISEASISYI